MTDIKWTDDNGIEQEGEPVFDSVPLLRAYARAERKAREAAEQKHRVSSLIVTRQKDAINRLKHALTLHRMALEAHTPDPKYDDKDDQIEFFLELAIHAVEEMKPEDREDLDARIEEISRDLPPEQT